MDRKNYDVFSPIKNSEEEKKIRLSDSFSKFLIGPDAFRNSPTTELHTVESSVQSGAAEASGSKEVKRNYDPSSSQYSLLTQGNVNEKALSIKTISSEKSCQILQDKSAKGEAKKVEALSLPSLILEDPLFTCPESSSSLKKIDETDDLQFGFIEKNKDFSDTSLPAKYDKQTKDQQNEAQYKTEGKPTLDTNILEQHSIEKSLQVNAAGISKASAPNEINKSKSPTSMNQYDPLSQLFSVKSSVQSDAAVASEASRSKENKNHSPSSVDQHNPLSEIQSKIEKMVSDAVESQVDNLQQLAHSHFYSLFKALHETKETAEHNHASERETLCKIMEELAEENRQLRNAASSHK